MKQGSKEAGKGSHTVHLLVGVGTVTIIPVCDFAVHGHVMLRFTHTTHYQQQANLETMGGVAFGRDLWQRPF